IEEGFLRLLPDAEYHRGEIFCVYKVGGELYCFRTCLTRDSGRSSKGATAAGALEPDPSSPTIIMSLGGIYQPEWGVTNGCRLDTPSSCQELVDHLAPLGYFSELRHLPNEEFLGQFNMTLARHVAMGSQLRLRFEQEAKLLRKSVAQVARRDQRIQAMEGEKKSLETLLEAEADIRRAVEAKNAELVKEMESLRAQFTELQVSSDGLSHQVSTLQAQTFANMVSAGITKGFCNGLKYEVEQGEAKLDLAMVEGYDPEAEGKFIATMQALKDLKYPLIDELEKLRDAPMDVLMASLYLESDTRTDAPQWIRDLR
ncbi:putative gypsy type transposase, partial [Tanacetum coccineum]